MVMYNSPLVSIFFGDRNQKIEPLKCKSLTSTSLFLEEPFSELRKHMNLSALTFLHQVHKVDGKIIKENKNIKQDLLFSEEGDYLVTNKPTLGLGVVTADCLPIVYLDKAKKVAAIAHAGWKGSVAGIASTVVFSMENYFSSNKKDIEIFFGPSAKECCYEVDDSFLKKIGSDCAAKKSLIKKK